MIICKRKILLKHLKFLNLLILSFSIVSCAVAQTPKKEEKMPEKKANEKIEACQPTPLNDPSAEAKTIAEGAMSRVETPFIFIARDAKTYEKLRSLVEDLPAVSEIDFTKQAAVAAFAGTKNTGGYSVSIKQTGENASVEVVKPPKDALVTMALTSPFKIALVPVEEEKSLESDGFG